MSDQITCSDCGGAFLFTDAEREFYLSKGLAVPPKRCKPCRQARKVERGDGAPARGFQDGGGSRARPNGSGGGFGDRRPAPAGRGFGGASQHGRGDRPAFRPAVGAMPAPRGDRPAPRGDRPAPRGDRPAPRAGQPSRYGAQNGAHGGGQNGSHSGHDFRSPPPRGGSPDHARQGTFSRTSSPARTSGAAPDAVVAKVRPERQKYSIHCATCGIHAEVPFKPIDGREIFCQPCYRSRRAQPNAAPPSIDVSEADSGIVE